MNSAAYYTSFIQTTARVRRDRALRAKPKCKPGNKPCGQRCIPQEDICRQNSAGMRGAIPAALAATAVLATAGTLYAKNKQRQKSQTEDKELDEGWNRLGHESTEILRRVQGKKKRS
jgi:hypothetical protein